ncbi:hypothetical protein SEA_OBLADI_79 [Gordonia phage ObLaDi]|uniref:Uncharacterized protein n=2 Tax=Cafassovirus TaxID=3425056 RepID=A0A9E7QBX5_9CAUD|nr:hypothetical protein SEA_ALEEMILY_78 [Gordonia phage Aleemily]UXE03802.1 hypothetical protein SEA_OBLADI_79 [Gordonia phage ObLaDi]
MTSDEDLEYTLESTTRTFTVVLHNAPATKRPYATMAMLPTRAIITECTGGRSPDVNLHGFLILNGKPTKRTTDERFGDVLNPSERMNHAPDWVRDLVADVLAKADGDE